jgi:hypothetical protein
MKMFKRFCLLLVVIILFSACKKEDLRIYNEDDRTIKISDKISVDNGFRVRDPDLNMITYEDFLKYLSSSKHFLLVQQKDFLKTNSTDKVVVSLRYDIDDNINAAIKFAYRQNKYGITSTFYILHTAPYYGVTNSGYMVRNSNLIYYLKTLQDTFGNEIGFHNDLVTLQVIYEIEPKEFLKNELEWLRGNNINVTGTTAHGSPYTYLYKYNNAYFWYDNYDPVPGHQFVTKGFTTYTLERDSLSNYGFNYDGGKLKPDYFFSDSYTKNGKRWNMSQVDFDTIKPGKKVIILLHPQHWD